MQQNYSEKIIKQSCQHLNLDLYYRFKAKDICVFKWPRSVRLRLYASITEYDSVPQNDVAAYDSIFDDDIPRRLQTMACLTKIRGSCCCSIRNCWCTADSSEVLVGKLLLHKPFFYLRSLSSWFLKEARASSRREPSSNLAISAAGSARPNQ